MCLFSHPVEQADFRIKRGCCDQVLALTTHIEAGSEKNLKRAVAVIDLFSADSIWRKGEDETRKIDQSFYKRSMQNGKLFGLRTLTFAINCYEVPSQTRSVDIASKKNGEC